MKARVLTAVVGLPVLFAALLCVPLWGAGVVMALICGFGAYEFMSCTEKNAPRRTALWPALCGAAVPLIYALDGRSGAALALCCVLVLAQFSELMLSFRTGREPLRLEAVTNGFLAGGVIPLMLSGVVRLGLAEKNGKPWMLLPFIIAFSCDVGAYFAGRLIGGRKLCPRLSPNKTVAGALGGMITCTIVTALYGVVLRACGVEASVLLLALYGLVGSVACEVGDLSFSAVKRLYGIKDYGRILPGHGGMLDRFDSMFYLAPLLEMFLRTAPAIAV